MRKILWPVVLTTGLTGCASLTDIGDVLFGRNSQKITKTPIWLYKPDLVTQVNGQGSYTGVNVMTLLPTNEIKVWSLIDIDRVEISTCSRHDVCQKKAGDLACDKTRFTVPADWFGNPGKFMSYKFVPDAKEKDYACANMTIAVYNKNALAAWAYVVFNSAPEMGFPARMSCNANDLNFNGLSACSVKAETIQSISMDYPIDSYKAEDNCQIKKVVDGTFEFKPKVGWCRASFKSGKKFHDVIFNAYDEVLVR